MSQLQARLNRASGEASLAVVSDWGQQLIASRQVGEGAKGLSWDVVSGKCEFEYETRVLWYAGTHREWFY